VSKRKPITAEQLLAKIGDDRKLLRQVLRQALKLRAEKERRA
jgi:hypothetical protein